MRNLRAVGYVLRGTITGRFKVGLTNDLRGKLTTHFSSSAEFLDLIFVGAPEVTTEKEWHLKVMAKYQTFRLHADWLENDCGIDLEIATGKLLDVTSEGVDTYRRLVIEPMREKALRRKPIS